MAEKSGSDPRAAPCGAAPAFCFKTKHDSTMKAKFPLIDSHFNEGRFLGSKRYMCVSYCNQASTEI